MHLYMLEVARKHGVKFDTCQMPLNVMDSHFRSFGNLVLPELVKEGIGVLGMKSLANGVILRSKTVTALECLRYAISLPTSVVITGMDRLELIDQAYEAAMLPALTPVERQALLAKTARAAEDGAWEPFKTSTIHDSTVTHPEWLGREPARVRGLLNQ